MPHVRVLSVHATYGCRRRGRCCAAGWPIPVEVSRTAPIAAAVESGRLLPRTRSALFETAPDAPTETPVRLAMPGGQCIFFDREPAHCRVHGSLGHGALPLACRQFPRITVQDPRGASVTLSHYCPTAADLLESELPVTVLDQSPAFPAGGEYVGLDARDTLPPLLRPDMAMDWEAWWTFERRSVELLANSTGPIEATLARLRGIVEALRVWSPADGRLVDRVAATFERAPAWYRLIDVERLRDSLFEAVPDELGGALGPAGRTATGPGAHRRFLAAHAFANWTAFLGLDLRAWFRSIEAAHSLLAAGYAVGDADLVLRHLADPHVLARSFGRAAGPS